uniref:Protein kinase domain-containing protein n=1 Tax=Arcella intermedia TaxID=1963864 RepID=A0A6B2LT75_9EUKA
MVIGQLTEVFIKLFTRQMLKALVFLEQMSIVHRDFKSANLLIRVEEEAGTEGTISIKLADFGLAVAVSGTRSGRSVCGSRFWMSPEMLRNEGYGCKVRGLIQER